MQSTGSRSPVSALKRHRPAFLIDSGKAQRLFGFAPMEILAGTAAFVSDNGWRGRGSRSTKTSWCR